MPAVQETVDQVRRIDVDQYKYGFETLIESEKPPKGHSEDIVRFISAKKTEPEWMLNWRLDAYRRWLTMREPKWARVNYGPIDYQDLYYYSAPKRDPLKSTDEVDPEIPKPYDNLGPPLRDREILWGLLKPDGDDAEPEGGNGYSRVAVDAVFDSVSVATTFKDELKKAGVIFMPISEAIREHRAGAEISRHGGADHRHSSPRSPAVFSDGSFVYVPPGVRCPMELSTYFRINERNTGQFERTLIIADKGSYVSYLEGCTAPSRDENQLHAAVVELVALDDAEIKYSTIQNWYSGDAQGRGAFTISSTKRGDCRGKSAKISWTQLETGSAITWKYPSCILRGDTRAASSIRSPSRTATSRSIRHQDAAPGQEHDQPHHLEGHRGRPLAEHLSRPRVGASQGERCAQLHQLRLAADRRQMRRPTRCRISRRRIHRPCSSTRPRPRRSPRTCCSTAASAACRPRRPPRWWSTASSRTCCSSSPWSLPSRPRS